MRRAVQTPGSSNAGPWFRTRTERFLLSVLAAALLLATTLPGMGSSASGGAQEADLTSPDHVWFIGTLRHQLSSQVNAPSAWPHQGANGATRFARGARDPVPSGAGLWRTSRHQTLLLFGRLQLEGG